LIIFHPLGIEQLKNIVEIQLKHLMKRLADKKIVVELTDKAKEYLAKEGFDPVYGARPLKRIIQRDIQNPLALKLIDGTFKEGDKVKVDAEKGKLVFEKGK
jgi:ATP-dependent Clp protease ATP-binding subunit ClpB